MPILTGLRTATTVNQGLESSSSTWVFTAGQQWKGRTSRSISNFHHTQRQQHRIISGMPMIILNTYMAILYHVRGIAIVPEFATP
jgi:hypothetical protein